MTDKDREERNDERVLGLGIFVAALVCLFGFWWVSPGITFALAAVSLVALVIFFWKQGNPQ